MKVPFFGNDRQYEILKKQWLERANSVWSKGQYLAGREVEKLENRLAVLCERNYAVAPGSCVDGLSICLQYIKVKDAIVTNYTFVASGAAILNGGGRPQFVPVSSPNFSPSIDACAKALTSNTNCVVGVSLYGSMGNIDEIEDFCLKNNLILIEDAAQSFGASINGRKAGNFGFASCISFDPTKIIAGTSPAGCLLTDDEDLANFARSFRHHGKAGDDFIVPGRKSLVSTLEASLIDLKLDYLDDYIERRKVIARMYEEGLGNLSEVLLPNVREREVHTFHKYVIQLKRRDDLKSFLEKRGITTRIHYQKPISHYGLFNSYASGDDFETNALCAQVLSLPLFPELSMKRFIL